MADAPLAGLVLAGGHSRRMQADKATLEFAGESQLARAMRLVAAHTTRAFVSVRPDQRADAERARWPQIEDRLLDVGPAAGILAAQDALPDHAWLVVAVDLPLLDDATLAALVAARDPSAPATAYRSSGDGLPEPLCAIWEPSSRAPLAAFVEGGRSCPRKFLLTHGARLVTLATPHASANVNTPADSPRQSPRPPRGSAMISVDVQYHALLREQAGTSRERVATRATTAEALYQELRARHQLTPDVSQLRVAIDGEFAGWQDALADGAEVVFIRRSPAADDGAVRVQRPPARSRGASRDGRDRACGGFASSRAGSATSTTAARCSAWNTRRTRGSRSRKAERIVAEAIARFSVTHARCVHRVGELALGELAVWIGVSAPHRGEAFAACRYIIDEVKHRVPIWKKEY